MEITVDCSLYIHAVSPLTQSGFVLNIPNTAPASNPTILLASDYGYTNDATNCPLTFTLKTVSPDANYGGSTLIMGATPATSGEIKVDTSVPFPTKSFYVQLTARSATINSQQFSVTVRCWTDTNTVSLGGTWTQN